MKLPPPPAPLPGAEGRDARSLERQDSRPGSAVARGELSTALQATCVPLEQARSLPAAVYVSPQIFALEGRKLFAHSWLAVARETELPEPGSFVTHEVAGERILLVRAEDERLHAFYNVCRHRGARLVDEPCGRLRGAIACPYHAWSYALDGRLRRAPRMPPAPETDSLALLSMPLATRDGFVFVNLDSNAQWPAGEDGELPDLAALRLDTLARVRRLEYEVAANWKIICENYSECYHCTGVHPQLARLAELSSGGFESGARFSGGPMRLHDRVDTLSMSGRSHWPRLDQRANSDSRLVYYYLVYPNLMLGVHPDYLLTHRVWPLEPARSRVACELLVAPETTALADFDASGVIEFWDTTNRQDWALCERVQSGAGSRGYRPGPYHPSERCVQAFDRWYAQWLLSALAEGA